MSLLVKDFCHDMISNPSMESITRKLGLINCGNYKELFGTLNHLEITTFFVNLHKTFDHISKCESKIVLHHALQILHKGISFDTLHRQLITEEINFVPVLTKLLQVFSNDQQAILKVMQDLTIKFQVKRHELYLEKLIETLIEIISTDCEYSELAVNVLTNICLENIVCRTLLLRNMSCSELLKKLKCRNIYAAKLFSILNPDGFDTHKHHFLKLALVEIKKSLDEMNFHDLRRIVRFMNNWCGTANDAELNTILNYVKNSGAMENKNFGAIMNLIFDLLTNLVDSSTLNVSTLQEIQNIAFEWFDNNETKCNILKMLTSIVNKYSSECNMQQILSNLVDYSTQVKELKDYQIMLEFLRLLECTITKSGSTLLHEDQLYTIAEEILNETHLSNDTISCFIYISSIFLLCSELDISKYFPKTTKIMNDKKACILYAKGFLIRNIQITKVLLTLVQSKHFPIAEVSEVLFKENSVENGMLKSCNIVHSLLPDISYYPSKSQESKLDELIKRISETKSDDFLLELYQSKLNIYQNMIDTLTNARQHAEKDVSELLHVNAILRAQALETENYMLELKMKVSNMEQDNKLLTSEVKACKSTIENYNHTLEQKKLKINTISKTLQQRESTIAEYKQKQQEILKELDKKNQELTDIAEEHRKHLKKWEDISKQKQKKLDELAEFNNVLNKQNLELVKEKQHFLNLVKEQEVQIQKCEQKIQQYVSEVEEGEETRKIIMELMNKKLKKK